MHVHVCVCMYGFIYTSAEMNSKFYYLNSWSEYLINLLFKAIY